MMLHMLRIALRDLQWRSRRIALAVAGSALVLALALVMSGLSAGFVNETARTVGMARGTSWVIDAGGTGPFVGPPPLSKATVDQIVDEVGAEHAAPFVFGRQPAHASDGSIIGQHEHINLIGALPDRLGSPLVTAGVGIARAGDVVVDERLGAKLGETILLAEQRFTVVGLVKGARLLAGVPNAYVTIGDAQALLFRGQELVTAVIVDVAVAAPAGTRLVTNAEARTDGLRPVVNAQKTISMVRSLLWLVAALIVGSVMYLGALERTKDVAVLKGMGARSTSLAGSMMLQSAMLAAVAAVAASLIAMAISPLFPIPSEIPPMSLLSLPLVAVIVAMLSSLGAAKRLFSVQPALAFRS